MILEITLLEPKLVCSQESEGLTFNPAHVVTKQIPFSYTTSFHLLTSICML
jgi:hypothetical protein